MAKRSRRSQASDTQFNRSSVEIQPSTAHSSSSTGSYDRERVAVRAYELYMARGGGDGADMEDWLAAEREFSNGNSESRSQ